jgi:hypothetical protein
MVDERQAELAQGLPGVFARGPLVSPSRRKQAKVRASWLRMRSAGLGVLARCSLSQTPLKGQVVGMMRCFRTVIRQEAMFPVVGFSTSHSESRNETIEA